MLMPARIPSPLCLGLAALLALAACDDDSGGGITRENTAYRPEPLKPTAERIAALDLPDPELIEFPRVEALERPSPETFINLGWLTSPIPCPRRP